MSISENILINAPANQVWDIIIDADNFESVIKGIQKVEVLERPKAGLVGLKWRETRIVFGKQATEIMWITEAKEQEYYHTRAESHGAIYKTIVSLNVIGDKTELTLTFNTEAQTIMAKIMGWVFASMIKKAIKQCFLDDLNDIKRAAEMS